MTEMSFPEVYEPVGNEPRELEFVKSLWQMAETCRDARAHLADEAMKSRSEALKIISNAESENIVLSVIDREPERCSVHMARLAVLKLVQSKEFFVNTRIVSDHELKLYSQLRHCPVDHDNSRFEDIVCRAEEERLGYIRAIREINDIGCKLPIAKLGLNSVWRE